MMLRSLRTLSKPLKRIWNRPTTQPNSMQMPWPLPTPQKRPMHQLHNGPKTKRPLLKPTCRPIKRLQKKKRSKKPLKLSSMNRLLKTPLKRPKMRQNKL